MLKIKNYKKLTGEGVGEWFITHIIDTGDFYHFGFAKKRTSLTAYFTIRLEKESERWVVSGKQWGGHGKGYRMYMGAIPLDVWVTADWISDKDNMLSILGKIIEQQKV